MHAAIRALIQRPVAVGMLTLASVVFGFVALDRLPLELLPDISYPSLTIQTELPDAAPEEVEQLVTYPIEQVVGVVSGLRRYHSSSRAGVSELTLEFAWDVDMDIAALDVREKLDLVDLPQDALAPVVYRFDPSLDPVLRLALCADLPVPELRKLAEDVVRKQLETVPGVAAARVVGGAEEEVLVELDPERLVALGLTLEDVVARVAAANVNRSGGELRTSDRAYLLRTVRQYRSLADLEAIIVHESPDGARVHLADVGSATLGQKDREVRVRVRGAPAVELHIYKEGDANAVQVARAVRDRLRVLARDTRLTGTRFELLFDQARTIEAAVRDVQGAALVGALLAALVLFLFLRDLLSTLVISLSIPISVAITFLLMHVSGITLNVMSLGGLALGVGMLVDSSVVVLEAIARRRAEGQAVTEAVVHGTCEVAGGITASTLTTICVFLPLVFVDGVAGQLFFDQAMTVTFSLLAALAVSLTLIPTLLARGAHSLGWARRAAAAVASAAQRAVRPLTWAVERALGVLTVRYDGLLRGVTAAPWAAPLLAAGLLVATLPLVRDLGTELVPRIHQGEFYYDLELPEGTPLDRTDALAAALEAASAPLIAEFPIESLHVTVGGVPVLGDVRAGERQDHRARLHVRLADGTSRAVEAALCARLDAAFARIPDCPVRLGFPTLFTLRAPIEVEVYAPDLDDLARATARVRARLQELPGLADVQTSLSIGSPEVHVQLDPLRLARTGLTQAEVAATLSAQGLGAVATQYTAAEKPIDIRVRVAGARGSAPSEVAHRPLRVGVDGGPPLRLASVGALVAGEGPAEVRHVAGERAALVTARLAGTDLGSASVAIEGALRELQAQGALGARATAQLSGQNTELRASLRSLALALVLAVFLVYLVLASTFESLRLPFVIILTVPLGFIGVVLALWVGSFALGVFAMIGAILLAGIVVNNGIIFVARIQQHHDTGLTPSVAVRTAGRERLRPILITSATTVLGLLPLALGLGAGAELRQPLAVTVIGGLVVATALTLLVVPSGYLLAAGRRRTDTATHGGSP